MKPIDRSFLARLRARSEAFARVVAVVAAAFLTLGLSWVLGSAGYAPLRFGFIAITIAISWLGVAGTVSDEPLAPLLASLALLLLGFWQAVLWVFMLPSALGLAVAGVVIAHRP